MANKGLSISPQMHTTKLCQYDKHTYEGAATPVYNAQVIGCTFSSAGSWQAPFVREPYLLFSYWIPF